MAQFASSLGETEAAESDALTVLATAEPDALTAAARDARPPRRATLLRKLGLFSLVAGLAAACLLAFLHRAGPSHGAVQSEGLQVGQKSSIFDLAGALADGVEKSADAVKTAEASLQSVEKLAGEDGLGGLVAQLKETGKVLGTPLAEQKRLIAAFKKLTPEQKAAVKARLMNKFNLRHWTRVGVGVNASDCYPDEEELIGLCYKKCALLTNGSHPLRTSPWACCHENSTDCLTDSGSTCSGNSASGDSAGNGCPHPPGRCLRNEELFTGACYKRCAITSYDLLPFRTGPQTCCKKKSIWSFLDFKNCVTDAKYGTGGQA